jgi:hypothetical protein
MFDTLKTFSATFCVTLVSNPLIGGVVGEFGFVFTSKYFLQEDEATSAKMAIKYFAIFISISLEIYI